MTDDTHIGSQERRVAMLAEEILAEAHNGLFYDADDADEARFTRLRRIGAGVLAEVDRRDTETILAGLPATDRLWTPLLAVVLILSHQRDGVLLTVADDGHAAMPHGFVPVSQDPEAAVRELARRVMPGEEVVPVPHGICDSISAGLMQRHTYHLTYVVDVTFVPEESFAVPLCPAETATVTDPLTGYILAGAERDVLESPFRINSTIRELLAESVEIADSGRDSTTDPWNRERYRRVGDTARAVLAADAIGHEYRPRDFGPLDIATPVTAAEMLILGHDGRILLLERFDTGQWAMPGGGCEVGETSAATAVRECREELGVEVSVEGLAGVYDNRVIQAADPGEWVCFVYVGHLDGDSPEPSRTVEATDFGWYRPDELSTLDMYNSHDVKIERTLKLLAG
ncbi:ADP-ribose pyrophosphatase YjhB (NUDIX family) [Stackebrandtia albiflava]|uniref:ADP-ribose pyrophosphatase YjhB (NUDIX family) n=1 Tax=Stackebrandtia albiflava TaxID=406432 RepID=A0A562V3Y0_9ACTN|nr:NUDIX hydrolase N-terminal domain-containing protein [Stackebrandtia albiflava]TWJ12538.1 ADP-ribose pyrophosphatase YjhB (NUDIX family) [Stackebrandtia albiflava]